MRFAPPHTAANTSRKSAPSACERDVSRTDQLGRSRRSSRQIAASVSEPPVPAQALGSIRRTPTTTRGIRPTAHRRCPLFIRRLMFVLPVLVSRSIPDAARDGQRPHEKNNRSHHAANPSARNPPKQPAHQRHPAAHALSRSRKIHMPVTTISPAKTSATSCAVSPSPPKNGTAAAPTPDAILTAEARTVLD